LAGKDLVFAHRYITRSADAGGENFVSLSEAEFALRQAKALFLFAWQSHGLHYAVGQEIQHWLRQDLSVVMNGSRAYLDQAQSIADQQGILLVPVWIHCDASVLAQRLIARGRESAEEIAERLTRAQSYQAPPSALIIDNSTDFDSALTQLLTLLLSPSAYEHDA
jgi:ribose 1,5-bisphosphokinase